MKNYQKNSRNPSVPFSCMLEQLIAAVQHKSTENFQNFQKSQKFNRNSKLNNLYMKNYQKNSRNPSVPFSCMLEQLIAAVQHKSNKGHLNIHIWSLNLNLGFKPTSFNLVLAALAQNTFILPCHDHTSYCALH